MLEYLRYQGHAADRYIDFGKNGIFVNMSDLHDYEWKVTTKGNRISSLDRGISTRTLPIVIMCDSEEEGIAKRNSLLEIFDADVLAKQYGKLIVNDYYFRCYATKSTKGSYLYSKRCLMLSVILTSDYALWMRESITPFTAPSSSIAGDWLDYPYDYPHDFMRHVLTAVDNTGFVAANIRIVIYGPCSNPCITIGGHDYQCNCEIAMGEYLTIDSMAKTIMLTQSDGTMVNKFSSRSRDSYVFEKIPAGSNVVTWDGSFVFDIVVIEERSEPEWI